MVKYTVSLNSLVGEGGVRITFQIIVCDYIHNYSLEYMHLTKLAPWLHSPILVVLCYVRV